MTVAELLAELAHLEPEPMILGTVSLQDLETPALLVDVPSEDFTPDKDGSTSTRDVQIVAVGSTLEEREQLVSDVLDFVAGLRGTQFPVNIERENSNEGRRTLFGASITFRSLAELESGAK
jgi:hypothetical protein